MDPASATVWRLSDACSLARRASWRFTGVVADYSENAIPTEFLRGWLIRAATSIENRAMAVHPKRAQDDSVTKSLRGGSGSCGD